MRLTGDFNVSNAGKVTLREVSLMNYAKTLRDIDENELLATAAIYNAVAMRTQKEKIQVSDIYDSAEAQLQLFGRTKLDVDVEERNKADLLARINESLEKGG